MEPNNNIRFMDESGSSDVLQPNSVSMSNESKIQDFSNSANSVGIINSFSDSRAQILQNQDKSINTSDKKDEDLKQNLGVIEINKNINSRSFFLKAKDCDMRLYQENINIKIKNVIENYIQEEKLDEDTKYKFFYNDKRIENLENTIGDLNITNLSVIIAK